MAEELFDMSNRVDPCLAPLPPIPPPTAPTPSVPAELADDRGTPFGVKPAGLHEGRMRGAYWGEDGVASRYQELEDGYMCALTLLPPTLHATILVVCVGIFWLRRIFCVSPPPSVSSYVINDSEYLRDDCIFLLAEYL